MKIKNAITIIILLALISACTKKPEPTAQQTFFNNFKSLCGQVFTGASTFPDDPEHDFAGKLLVADFASCEDQQVRVKFVVGEDHSRTWVITKSDQGLLLKHDHRHADGTPDEITNYGGWANHCRRIRPAHPVLDDRRARLARHTGDRVYNAATAACLAMYEYSRQFPEG